MTNYEEFSAKRLRRVVNLCGLDDAVPASDAELLACMGSVLGMVARKLEEASVRVPAEDIDIFPHDEFDMFMRRYAWGDLTNYPRGRNWNFAIRPGVDMAIFLREIRDRTIEALRRAGRLTDLTKEPK